MKQFHELSVAKQDEFSNRIITELGDACFILLNYYNRMKSDGHDFVSDDTVSLALGWAVRKVAKYRKALDHNSVVSYYTKIFGFTCDLPEEKALLLIAKRATKGAAS